MQDTPESPGEPSPQPLSSLGPGRNGESLATTSGSPRKILDRSPAPIPPQPVFWWNVTQVLGRTTVRAYAVKLKLSPTNACITIGSDQTLDEVQNTKLQGHLGEAIALRLIGVPGVVDVSIWPFEVRVCIGAAFDWAQDGIQEAVELAIKECAPATSFTITQLLEPAS